jgi:hypothetical protein
LMRIGTDSTERNVGSVRFVAFQYLILCDLCVFARGFEVLAKIPFLFLAKKSPNSVSRQIRAPLQRVRVRWSSRRGDPGVRGSVRVRG